MNLLCILFGDIVNVRMEACPKQSGVDDCGVFVIAVCVGLATTGQLPQSFTQEKMRSHMLECLNSYSIFFVSLKHFLNKKYYYYSQSYIEMFSLFP